MATNLRLEMNEPQLGSRLKQLMSDLRASDEARSRFSNNPIKTVVESVFPEKAGRLPDLQISKGDELLSAALNDQAFIARMKALQTDFVARQSRGQPITREEAIQGIAEALIASANSRLTGAFLDIADSSAGGVTKDIFTDDIAIATKAVVLVLVVITVIDATPFAPAAQDFTVSPSEIQSLSDLLASRMR